MAIIDISPVERPLRHHAVRVRAPGLAIALITSALAASAVAGGWTHYCGDARHTSTRPSGPAQLNCVRWIAPVKSDEELIPSSTPLVFGGRVFAAGRRYTSNLHSNNEIVCFDADTGCRFWEALLPVDSRDSWSTPVIYEPLQTIIAPVDNKLIALDTSDGSFLWQSVLNRDIVNASPTVSTDLFKNNKPTNRVYITDYDLADLSPPFFGDSQLYAINVDAFEPDENPYLPGDIVWQQPVGASSGNSAVYYNERVYLSSPSRYVRCYNARTGALIWNREVPGQAFFGGVALSGGHVYAASYHFGGDGALVKIDACDGTLDWTIPCERTSTTPLVVGNRIFVSGGLDDGGATVNLQAFEDHGGYAELEWETDSGQGGPYRVGFWTAQPARSGNLLYVGRPSLDLFFANFTHLVAVNIALEPGDSDFIADEYAGAGGPIALHEGRAYSVGNDGLVAFDRRCLSTKDAGDQLDGTIWP